MKKYTFSFTGRQTGAIGITYKITDSYKAKDIHEAISLLYQDYDLIKGLRITLNSREIEKPAVIKWVNVRSHTERKRQQDRATYVHHQ